MKEHSGATRSIWMDEDYPTYDALDEDIDVDVAVVGAGIAGMTSAYLLAREGRSVAVLDMGRVGSGMTGRTTAHLASALDTRFVHLERLHGRPGARLAAQSHARAIGEIGNIVGRERIQCDFERLPGYLFLPPGTSADPLRREFDAARRAGLKVDWLAGGVAGWDFDGGACIRFADQGQFHPLRYLHGLARAVEKAGGRVYEGAHVMDYRGGDPAVVKTRDDWRVTAKDVIIATNHPINSKAVVFARQEPIRTYVVAAPVRGPLPRGLFWDALDLVRPDERYHYVRVHRVGGKDWLIVGGEDHRTGTQDNGGARFRDLERWAKTRFPIGRPAYRWSGQVMEPSDGLALIGTAPLARDHVYIATGDAGHGMTHGTIAGLLLSDVIMGRSSPWRGIYSPARSLGNLKAFVKAQGVPINRFLNIVKPARRRESRKSGRGVIVQRGLRKVGVVRDEQGITHEVSALCAHVGCVLDWNSTESTWDCGCHGSIYDMDGRVLNAPATSDLRSSTKWPDGKRRVKGRRAPVQRRAGRSGAQDHSRLETRAGPASRQGRKNATRRQRSLHVEAETPGRTRRGKLS